MSIPTLPLTALWFLASLVSSSAALSSEVQTAIDSLWALPRPEEPAAPDSAAAWDLPADFPEEGVKVRATIDNLSVTDAEERRKYNLFAGVRGFVSAAYFRRPDGGYFIHLVIRGEEGE